MNLTAAEVMEELRFLTAGVVLVNIGGPRRPAVKVHLVIDLLRLDFQTTKELHDLTSR